MTYKLAIGDRTYSSWSLRGWLLFAAFDLPVSVQTARMYSQEFKDLCAEFAPTKLVPAARMGNAVVWESFAIAEELASRHPDSGFWPSDPSARAMARAIVSEMHSSFVHLRTDCTMNLRHSYPDFKPSDAVLADCTRIEKLWEMAKEAHGQNGPWLFGDYSIADVFYAPVATRFATYHLPRGKVAQDYINAHLNEANFRRWRAMGLAENYVQPGYDLDLPASAWTGPTPISATAVDGTESENSKCPYSGNSITHVLEIDGRRIGFCNAFCRDKTVADPEAWPDFMAVYLS